MADHCGSLAWEGSFAKNCPTAADGNVPSTKRDRCISAVMYAIEKIASDIETKTDLRKRVVNVKQQLYGQGAVI